MSNESTNPTPSTILSDLRPGDRVSYSGASGKGNTFRVITVDAETGAIQTVGTVTGQFAYFGFNRRVAMTEHRRPVPAASGILSRGDILWHRETNVEYFLEHADANDFDMTTTDGKRGTEFVPASRLHEFDVLRPVVAEPEDADDDDPEPPAPKDYVGHDFFPVDMEDANDLMNAIQEAVTTGSSGDAEAARLGAIYDRLQQHFASLYSLGQRLPRS